MTPEEKLQKLLDAGMCFAAVGKLLYENEISSWEEAALTREDFIEFYHLWWKVYHNKFEQDKRDD